MYDVIFCSVLCRKKLKLALKIDTNNHQSVKKIGNKLKETYQSQENERKPNYCSSECKEVERRGSEHTIGVATVMV